MDQERVRFGPIGPPPLSTQSTAIGGTEYGCNRPWTAAKEGPRTEVSIERSITGPFTGRG
jgi:hypothetical protein